MSMITPPVVRLFEDEIAERVFYFRGVLHQYKVELSFEHRGITRTEMKIFNFEIPRDCAKRITISQLLPETEFKVCQMFSAALNPHSIPTSTRANPMAYMGAVPGVDDQVFDFDYTPPPPPAPPATPPPESYRDPRNGVEGESPEPPLIS